MSPPQAAENDTGNKSDTGQASVEPDDDVILPTQKNQNDASSIDDSILNSEIYQIYCQAEDSNMAAQLIKQHKNCVSFERERQPFLIPEEEYKRLIESTLINLWRREPGETKFDRVKKFIDGTIKNEVLGGSCYFKSMRGIFMENMTRIQILNPKGYEYFYVANFKLGHPRSWERQNGTVGFAKWFRAESYESGKAQRLAQLHVLGISNATLDQIQLNHYLSKNSKMIKWSDFAQRIISGNQDDECLIRGGPFGGHQGMFYLIIYDS